MDDHHLDEYFRKLDASDRLMEITPAFMATTTSMLADLYYRNYIGASLPPRGGDPEAMRRAHALALKATELSMSKFKAVFGEERWAATWKLLAHALSGPAEVIIHLAEQQQDGVS